MKGMGDTRIGEPSSQFVFKLRVPFPFAMANSKTTVFGLWCVKPSIDLVG